MGVGDGGNFSEGRGGEGYAGSEREINKNGGEQRWNHEKNCFF